MKRLAPLCFLAFVGVLALAACSDDSNGTSDSRGEGIAADATADGQGKDLGPDATTPDSAGDTQASDTTPPGEAGTDSAPGDAGNNADALAACPTPMVWQYLGGLVAYRDKSTLTNCSAFLLERSGTVNLQCMTTLAANDADLAKVTAALSRSDTQAALTTGTGKLYGRDTRPVDGQVFEVTIAGRQALVGSPCTSSGSSCTPIPAGLAALRTALLDLTATQRAKAACAALNP
ncbi:MAG: hypothetical protein KC503_03555 [Myxococcales bacterium]|nr:hypothetical protein [Myxococcales bacterium]